MQRLSAMMNSSHISEEMQMQQQPKMIAKKSFLRKGSRNEPIGIAMRQSISNNNSNNRKSTTNTVARVSQD